METQNPNDVDYVHPSDAGNRMYSDPLDLLVENIMDLARENSIDDARIYIKDRIVKDALKPLVVALLRAKATIRQWNGMHLSGDAERACWEAYQSSPEMKEINAALENAK